MIKNINISNVVCTTTKGQVSKTTATEMEALRSTINAALI
jgi:hypothetical protein